MTVLSKKQIRSSIGYSDRKTFNSHIAKSGIKKRLPAIWWNRYLFFEDELLQLELIFNHKFIEA